MQNSFKDAIRDAVAIGVADTADIIDLVHDGAARHRAIDALLMLRDGDAFFTLAQFLDGAEACGIVCPRITKIVHLLGTVSCADVELGELIDALRELEVAQAAA